MKAICVESMNECLVYESALRKDDLESVQFLHTLFTLCHGFRVSEAFTAAAMRTLPLQLPFTEFAKASGMTGVCERNFNRDGKLHSNEI
jgi:hypothetical protein